MKITKDGRELSEEEQIQFLIKELGWSEGRARQRVEIANGKRRGDIVWPEGMEPPPINMAMYRRPVKTTDPADDA
jgi:hypothetical protein